MSDDLTAAEDSLNHRVSVLEQDVAYLKNINDELCMENNELRIKLNEVVKELNCVVMHLNDNYNV